MKDLLRGLRELIRFWFEASVIAGAIAILYLMGVPPDLLCAFLVGLLSGSLTLFRLNPAYWLHPPLEHFEESPEEEPQKESFQPIATLHRLPILEETAEFVVRRLDGRDQFLQKSDATVAVYTGELSQALVFRDLLTAWDAAIHCYALCDREYSFMVEAIAPALDVEQFATQETA